MSKVKVKVEALLIYSPAEKLWILYGENGIDDGKGMFLVAGEPLGNPELLCRLAEGQLWYDEMGEITKRVSFETEIEVPESTETVKATVSDA